MSLGPEVEAVLARVLDESERAENSVQFIEEVKREFQCLIEAEALEACTRIWLESGCFWFCDESVS